MTPACNSLRLGVWMARAVTGFACVACGGTASDGSAPPPSSSATCPDVAPCGGDLTGTWRITRECIDEAAWEQQANATLPPECAGANTNARVLSTNATETFGTDGTVTLTGDELLSYEINYTSACFQAVDAIALTPTSCSAWSTRANHDMQSIDPRNSATCAYSSGACLCSIRQYVNLTATTGYRAQGTTIYVAMASADYCVQGNELIIHSDTGSRVLAR